MKIRSTYAFTIACEQKGEDFLKGMQCYGQQNLLNFRGIPSHLGYFYRIRYVASFRSFSLGVRNKVKEWGKPWTNG